MQTTIPGIALLTVLVFTAAGILYTRRKKLSAETYLVDRNRMGPATAMATIVASVAGAWILFSPPETVTWAGAIGLVGYGLGQAAPLLAFALLGPRLRRLMPNGHSLNEFVRHRFGGPMSDFVIVLMLFYMMTFAVAELTGISLAVRIIAGVPLWVTALLVMSATLAYTVYGGIRASIFTDGLQFLLIVPLLVALLVFGLHLEGGGTAVIERLHAVRPDVLAWNNPEGIRFGLTLIIAILAANMFHQGFWQRVYSCRDERTVRAAFFTGGLVVIPMIILAGLFGFIALTHHLPEAEYSVALFKLTVASFPPWAVAGVLILALALVMSSLDTLLNGLVSIFAAGLADRRPDAGRHHLLRKSRLGTILLALPAIPIAARGYDVLYLFLIADLVCSGAVFPVFYGLFARRLTGGQALSSCLVGLAAGALFFPKPDHTPIFPGLPGAGDFLISFSSALLVSAAAAILFELWNARRKRPPYDFARLAEEVQPIGK